MSRFVAIAIGCLIVLAGCQAVSSSACPAIGPDGEHVDNAVCTDQKAGSLSLSFDQETDKVRITVENVGDEAVLVNPDRWTVFRKAGDKQQSTENKWSVAANAPAGTHNLTVVELSPGETMTWQLNYKPNASDPQNHRDLVLTRSGQYVFSLTANNRTYTGSFRVGN